MKVLLVNKQAFIDWYFDKDITDSFFDDQGILRKLKSNGEFSITLQDLLDNVGYVPEEILEDGQEYKIDLETGDVNTFDCELKFS